MAIELVELTPLMRTFVGLLETRTAEATFAAMNSANTHAVGGLIPVTRVK